MNSQLSLKELSERLTKLERQNRRFKQFAGAILSLVAVVAIMGQAPSRKVVEVNELLLKDSSGKVRMRLSVQDQDLGSDGFPKMVFLDAKGNTSLELDGSIHGLFGGTVGINDEQGQRVSTWFADGSLGGVFWLSNGHPRGNGSSGVALLPGSVEVTDQEGFEATVGVEDLVTPHTGESHKTSAASVVLFDSKKNVIWKAP